MDYSCIYTVCYIVCVFVIISKERIYNSYAAILNKKKIMENAKIEFLCEVGNKRVKCARVCIKDETSYINLKVGFTEEDYIRFLNEIDKEYHSGYGGQELYGFIWYENGTWSERYEYDGLEWWDYKVSPEIPKELC